MQNHILKFRQNSIVFEKPGIILSENLKTVTSSNYPAFHYFLLKLCTRFLLTNVYKKVCGIFLFCLDLELFAKVLKDLVSTHLFFTLLLITQGLNKMKKSRTSFCRQIQVGNVCKISAENIKFFGSWSSSKFSIFQTKKLVSWK